MIISTALNILGKELEAFLAAQFPMGSPTISVMVDNVEQSTGDPSMQDEGVIISLIRIEEERTLSNHPGKKRTQNASQFTVHRADLHLNLYVLLSTNFQQYNNALIALSYALGFFHAKPSFTPVNLMYPDLLEDISVDQRAEFKLNVELHSLSYEQTNYLWSTFGGQQTPHFVLKARLVQIVPELPLTIGTAIEEIQSQEFIN